MNRSCAALILAAVSLCRSSAAEQNQLDANQNLFTVLAALNAAGYDTDLDSPQNSPLRKQLRDVLAQRKIPVLEDIRAYYKNHPKGISPYISLALTLSRAPEFTFQGRTIDIPPDAATLGDFGPLLARFYQEAGIEDLWRRSQPAFDSVIAQYHEPVSRATLEVNAYLRSPSAGYLGRHFQIYLDLLSAPGQVHTRSYGDNYFVVISPAAQLKLKEIRHAYLHFVTDPLATKYGMSVMRYASLSDYAQPAAMLEDTYKNDFVLLTSECLIKAIESRLDKAPQTVEQALHEGYILTPFFYEQLVAYEKQPQAMRLYFPDMVNTIDREHERRRLEHITFTAKAAPAAPAEAPAPVLSKSAHTTARAEVLYTAHDYEEARKLYLRALEEPGSPSDHSSAYYGLARLALRANNAELAERLFSKVLESSPDAQSQAWSLVYLGRLNDIAGDRDKASRFYQQALSVKGASEQARKAAEKGVQETFKK